MVNFKLSMKCEKWTDQHKWHKRGTEKNLSPRQESNPWPPGHRVGILSTELRQEPITWKIAVTQRGALLPERAPGAKSLVCIGV